MVNSLRFSDWRRLGCLFYKLSCPRTEIPAPMELNLCRFCLGTNQSQKNPLISPCQCKGSMEFVHFKCLNRWRHVDIGRNGLTCSLCMTNYTLPRLHEYEIAPVPNTCSLYILHYPGLSLSLYHYIFIILLSSKTPNQNFEITDLMKSIACFPSNSVCGTENS